MVTVGSVFVDVKGCPDEALAPGGRTVGHVIQSHGGVARNIAEDMANCGADSRFVGLVDDSGIGGDVRRRLSDRGVDVRFLRTVPGGMGLWLAVFDEKGDVAAAISQRPDLRALDDILDECGPEIFADAEGLLLELDLEEETLRRACALAEKGNVPIFAAVSNMTLARAHRAFLPRLSCFVCNRQEYGILFPGEDTALPPADLALRLMERIRAEGLRAMVVTLGADGAVWASGAGETGYVPPEEVAVTDTTGAGDAFFAGVSLALTRGEGLPAACRFGTALAARVLRTLENVCPPMDPADLGLGR